MPGLSALRANSSPRAREQMRVKSQRPQFSNSAQNSLNSPGTAGNDPAATPPTIASIIAAKRSALAGVAS